MENIYTGYSSRHMPDFKVISSLPNSTISREEAILSLVVVLGSSISLVGLIFAFITYSLFSDLRNMSGTMIMNLLATLFMSQLMYVIGVGGTEDPELCVSLAFSLQYFHLSEFCWLAALTFNMYYTFRNNINLIPSFQAAKVITIFVKYSLFGWVFPIGLVCLAYLLHRHSTADCHQSTKTFRIDYLNCWFLGETIYFYSYVFPVLLLLSAIGYRMYKTWIIIKYSVALQIDYKMKQKMRKIRRLQYFLYVKVILLLSSTFVSGVIARLSHWNSAWIMFNVQHSLQGLLVSIVVACNCQILKIYAKSIRRKHRGRKRKENLIDIRRLNKSSNDLSKSTSLDDSSSSAWSPEVLPVSV